MKRMTGIVVLFALLISLCACGETEKTALRLYLPAETTEGELLTEAIVDVDYHGTGTTADLLNVLLPKLGMGELYRYTQEGGSLWVDLTGENSTLTGIDRTLVQSCIVLTLLQTEGVERVCVTEEGAPFVGTEYILLTEKDMLFAGAEEEPRQMSVELYFPRSGGRGLGFEVRELTITEDDDLYTAVTQALLAGPESSTLRALFPEGTEVLDVRMDDGVCYVNFSVELVDGAPADMAEQDLLLYSIVDTLGNLDGVNAVQVLVEGVVPKNYGNADTSFPLEPDFGLLARE